MYVGAVRSSGPIKIRGLDSLQFRVYFHQANNTAATKLKQERVKLAPKEQVDKVYRQLISDHPLSDEHKAQLKKRGIPESKWEMYGTIKRHPDGRIKWTGMRAQGVPGFFLHNDDWHFSTYFQGETGLIVPSVDKNGLIHSFQIRVDGDAEGARYIWFSSGKLPAGVKARITSHIAEPDFIEDNRVWLTEGHFKAETSAHMIGARFISIPGIGNIQSIFEALEKMNATEVVLAIDLDKATNKHVKAHYDNLLKRLIDMDYTVYVANWESESWQYCKLKNRKCETIYQYKGIDDALVGGVVPTVEKVHASKTMGTYLSIDQAERLMKDDMRQVYCYPDKKLHLFSSTTGVGKTTAMLDILDLIPPGRKTVWVSDNYKLINEAREKLGRHVEVLRGRQYESGKDFYCSEKNKVDRASKAGHNIAMSVCMRCPVKIQNCNYHKRVREVMKEDLVFATKHALLNSSSRIDNFEIIICDEALHQWLYTSTTVEMFEIDDAMRCLLTIDDVDEDHEHYRQLKAIKIAMENAKDANEEFEYDWLVTEPPNLKRPFFFKDRGFIYPKNFIEALPDSAVRVNKDRLTLITPNIALIEKLKDKTIINLDATPIPSLLSALNPVMHEYRVKQNLNIIQISNIKGSKRQLMENEHYQELFVRAIDKLAGLKRSAVFSIRAFTEVLKEKMENIGNVLTGYFGKDTRGTNDYMEYPQHIVAGDYCINLGYLEMLSSASKMIGTPASVDQIAQEIANAEILQAIGRARGARSEEKKDVYILTNRKVEGVPVHHRIRLQDILNIPDKRELNNQRRQDEAEDRVRRAIKELIQKNPKHLWELSVDDVMFKSKVSRPVVKRVLERIRTRDELQPLIQDAVKSENLKLAAEPNNHSEFTSPKGIDTNILRTDALRPVNSNSLFASHEVKQLSSYKPLNVKSCKWEQFVTSLEGSENATQISRKSGLSRKYVKIYLEIAEIALSWNEILNTSISEGRIEAIDPERLFYIAWTEHMVATNPSKVKLYSKLYSRLTDEEVHWWAKDELAKLYESWCFAESDETDFVKELDKEKALS